MLIKRAPEQKFAFFRLKISKTKSLEKVGNKSFLDIQKTTEVFASQKSKEYSEFENSVIDNFHQLLALSTFSVSNTG